MSQIEYITIKNASRKVLNRMRQIGVDKAQRLQKIQDRWEAGDYKDVEDYPAPHISSSCVVISSDSNSPE
jgi:hypothetical protein